MVFCNAKCWMEIQTVYEVTILILIDGFLQYRQTIVKKEDKDSHNPYFNRWFSAII